MSRYSEIVMDHFVQPRNRGKLENPSGVGVVGVPGEGPFLVFQIACTGGIIAAAAFQCHNCGVMVASGSVLTTMTIGKTLQECRLISADDIILQLDGVPPDKLHGPRFALEAMRLAIQNSSCS
ncbi:MAG: iron-sulfur cluster assembly scaffold protein [Planctomyces sp.]|nr:iron-sulfur cluster assembly scaffold protein [Planctomyces sp.]